MTNPQFDFEREEKARRTGLTEAIANQIHRKLADQIKKEAGELFDRLYPNLKHDRLRNAFILAIFMGVSDIVIEETR